MSLRSKVIGTLLCVLSFYVFAAWLVLVYVHKPAFDSLEKSNASDQLRRVHEFIASESADLDLLVRDWAVWDELLLFTRGENDDFYEDNLSGGYLGEIGMNFSAILSKNGNLVWGQAFSSDGSIDLLDTVFPEKFLKYETLLSPEKAGDQISGLIATALGPAMVSSAAILWSDGSGPAAGHMIAGKLLDADRMEVIGKTVLSTIDLLSVEANPFPQVMHKPIRELLSGDTQQAILKNRDTLYSIKLLNDINNQPLALLRVSGTTDITSLGADTVRITISILFLAAFVLTLTLWIVLKGMLLLPIEQLTSVMRNENNAELDLDGGSLLSTMKRLTDSKSKMSKRDDEIGALIGAFHNLSSLLHDATINMWRIAHIDGLTGLANRRLLLERLSDATNNQERVALLFIDLDGFKNVNDVHGHEAGDQLLIEVASRISSVVRADEHAVGQNGGSADIVARIGGDEFVVMQILSDSAENVCESAQRIVDCVAHPFSLGDAHCSIGASVGFAIFPEDAHDVNGLLGHADAAMYQAKREGKNSWRRYTEELFFVSQKQA